MAHRQTNKENTLAINCDLVYKEACRLPYDIHVIFHFFITLGIFSCFRFRLLAFLVLSVYLMGNFVC